ncbi:MAG: GNAT family N-acetyltransferase [Clostridiales bacterium]|nr:GNAT family N-acetyltransferase [Clostridiales bacterium]
MEILQTQRLLLRPVYTYLSDKAVVRYEPYAPMTKSACRDATAHMADSSGFWAVCRKGYDVPIGQICLVPQEHSTWELGYIFHRSYQGQGYATESVCVLLDDSFQNQKVHRITAQCNPENTPSWRLLERLGFQREGHLRRNISFRTAPNGVPVWQDTYLYALLSEEWEACIQYSSNQREKTL